MIFTFLAKYDVMTDHIKCLHFSCTEVAQIASKKVMLLLEVNTDK